MDRNVFYKYEQYIQKRDAFNGALDFYADINKSTFKEYCSKFYEEFSKKFYNDYPSNNLDDFDDIPDSIKQKMLSAIYFYHIMLDEYMAYKKDLEFRNRKQKASRVNSSKINKLKGAIPILKEISEIRFDSAIKEIETAISEYEHPQLLEERKKQIIEHTNNVIDNYDFLQSELNKAKTYQPNGSSEFARQANIIRNIEETISKIENNDVQIIAMEQKKLQNNFIDTPNKPTQQDLVDYLLYIIDDSYRLKNKIKTLVGYLSK